MGALAKRALGAEAPHSADESNLCDLPDGIWERLEPLVRKAERPSRYINHEWGSELKRDANFRFCMLYPDTYELGQANQALRILVNAVNEREGMAAERGFLPAPEMCDVLRQEGLPLCSLESCTPLANFDVIGITLPHELAATNVLEILDLAGLPLRAGDRAESDPLVIGGGPCAYNPEPYAAFFDAFNIGEGECMLPDGLEVIARTRASGATREEVLCALAKLPGWYVPSLYEELDAQSAQQEGSWVRARGGTAPLASAVVQKQIFEGFAEKSGWEPCVVPFTEVIHDRLNVEVLRGCARGCRFCQAGMIYRPVRERSVDNVVASVCEGLAKTGYDEVSLTSLSSTDHSQIEQILERLNETFAETGVRVSLPSQRLDSFGVGMAALVAGQKKGGLTFAPEAGTQRLRDVINKNVTENDLFSALDAAYAAGWRRAKLYFMIGLPTETDEDIKGIASLVQRAYDHVRQAMPPEQKGSFQLSVAVSLFVPKSHTPFQWDGQITPEEAWRRVDLLRRSIKYRAIAVNWHDPSTSFIEAVISRAGREGAQLIQAAWQRGARFDAWTECFNMQAWSDAALACGIDWNSIAQTTYEPTWVLPWAHISCGVSTKWLALERNRAQQEITTPDCTFEACSVCGACPHLGYENELAQARGAAGEARFSALHSMPPREAEGEVR